MFRRRIAAVLATAGLLATAGGGVPTAAASSLPGLPTFPGLSSVVTPGEGVVGEWGYTTGNQPRITVHADGRVGGYDGCNSFGTVWVQTPDGHLVFSRTAWVSTMRYCSWEWFPAARTATVEGNLMRVYDGTGELIGVLPRV